MYIDEFNLYYGAVKNISWEWLSIGRYFSPLLPDDEIQIIKYFTAKMLGSHKANQGAYIKALLTLNKVQIIYSLALNK